MKLQFTALAFAAVLTIGASLPGYAEDAKPEAAAPATTDVARPSITPKTAEPASAPAATEAAPRRHRRYARHHYRRYGHWEPFPVYLPHFHRHHISWARIRWFF